MEPAHPVQISSYQSNNYRKYLGQWTGFYMITASVMKDLSWLHFADEPRVQEEQQAK